MRGNILKPRYYIVAYNMISKGYVVVRVQMDWGERERQMFWHIIMVTYHTYNLESETHVSQSWRKERLKN